MPAVPLGRGAYKRLYSGSPEVRLLNRWVESNPTNLVTGVALLARPATTPLKTLSQGSFVGLGSMRGNYALSGLFSDSLFTVCGSTLYRIKQDLSVTAISGVIQGTGYPEVAWQKGAGYERLWISDGLTLQFYSGTSFASATITKVGAIVNGTDKLNIGGVFYVWGTVFSGTDAGTTSNPFVINPLTDPMTQLVKAVMASGVAGVDYSTTLGGQNVNAMAQSVTGVIPETQVKITARVSGVSGNSIVLLVVAGTGLTATGGGHLINGGVEALQGCTIPDGQVPISLSQISSYVLVGIANSQKFFWVNPGATIINALDFASKESSPDNIAHIRAVGDQVLIIGSKSTENWYATGVFAAPFAPIEGRVYARGAIAGTPVVVDDGVFLVGDDGRAYSIGYQSGDTTDSGFGVKRVSNNGIEERIRRQIRREGGLIP